MQNKSKSADKATQVVATAQPNNTIYPYGQSVSENRKAFQMKPNAQLSKQQIMHTHYLLTEPHFPNLKNIIDVFTQLVNNAPYANQKPADVRRANVYIYYLTAIYKNAHQENFLLEVENNVPVKRIILKDVTQKVNYASLQAMENLRTAKNAFQKPKFPNHSALAGQILSIILNLYVPKLDYDQEFAMDALLQLFIEYDK